MGTDKRERQKANRALRYKQQAKQQRTATWKRNGLRIGIGAVAALAAVVVIAWAGGAFDGDDDTIETADELDTGTSVLESTPLADPTTPASGDTTATSAPAAIGSTECPAADGSSEQQREFEGPPPMCIDPAATYAAEVVTNQGDFTVELDPEQAPTAVNSFVVLARYHYFDDTVCHRIIPEFVVQCGDPTATGTGGPGYALPDELPEAGEYQIGSLAMANSGPDTSGSQFFVITGENGAALPPSYTLFGQVSDGLDDTLPTLDALGNPDPAANGVPPLEEVRIESITITET